MNTYLHDINNFQYIHRVLGSRGSAVTSALACRPGDHGHRCEKNDLNLPKLGTNKQSWGVGRVGFVLATAFTECRLFSRSAYCSHKLPTVLTECRLFCKNMGATVTNSPRLQAWERFFTFTCPQEYSYSRDNNVQRTRQHRQ